MKNLRTRLLIICISLFSINASSQQAEIPINTPDQNMPELFIQAPDKLAVETTQMASLLNFQVGDPVVLNLPSFRFEGTVITVVSKYSNSLQGIVIRSTNFDGATLTLSRYMDDSKNFVYTGRIVSRKHGDLYLLKQEKDGLSLVKGKYNAVVAE